MTTLRRWVPALTWAVLLIGLGILLVWRGAEESLWAPAMLLPMVWLASPLAFPRIISHAEAAERAEAEPGTVRIFVRPGSLFCVWLRWKLHGLAREVLWIDVWADDEAAVQVRELGCGELLVPVVMVDDVTRHNPPADWVAHHVTPPKGSGR